jgi:Tol biopolymer transport system component
MMRVYVGPARALALAGILAVSVLPGVASAQRARVNTVEISPADAQVPVGQQQVFLANAYDRQNSPVSAATFTFSSSDPRIATIDANGIAVGVSPGTAIITARTGVGAAAKSARATLTVLGASQAGPAGGPTVQPQGAATPQIPNLPRPVIGRPTGPGYAAFDRQPDGSGPAEALFVSPPRVVLVRGESKQLEYRAVRADDGNADRVPINFIVAPGGERLISVDSVGFVRAAGDTGRAIVRAEVPNSRIPPRPVLVDVRGDSVRFQVAEIWLPVGTVDTLRMIVPAQDRPLNVQGDFNFRSSDETKVRVSSLRPVVTAVAPGMARITGDSPFFSVATQVHVLRPVAILAATPADSVLTLAMGTTQAIAVRPLGADSTVVTEAPLRWTLPDTAVARFDTTTKALRAVRMGETRLAVRAPFARDSFTTRTWRIRVVAGGLAVSRTRLGLGVGERAPLTVQLLDDRRQPIGPATHLTWTSSADSIARFADGAVQGLKIGRARLTARTSWDSVAHTDVYVSGQLLAAAQRAGRWDLYEFNADSTPRFVPITNDAAVELEPAFSPDLTRIAYVTAPVDRPSSQELYVANADGSDARRLTFDSATVGSPVFVRPNGEQIVFQSNKGGRAQVHVINRDGTGRRQLTSGDAPNTQPDVSPDGRKLLFVSLRQPAGGSRNYDVWEMNIDGTGERRLTTSPRPEDTPRYAPDGRSFYYLRDEAGSPPTKRVYRQLLADSTSAALTPAGTFVRAFSVNADGTLLALTKLVNVRGVGDVPQVELLNPATGAIIPIRVAAGEQLSGPTFRPASPASPAAPPPPVTPPAPVPAVPTARPPQ